MADARGRHSDSPKVSVIMNCLNSEKYLRDAIDSVYAQTYQDWEIIFWDNASSDSSPKIAQSYDNRLNYFRGDITIPLYAARNLALRQAKGNYIAFLDCDDSWLSNKLERQVELFEKNRKIGLAYSNVEILESNGNRRNKFSSVQPSGQAFRQLLKNYNINIATVMIRRESLNLSGYFFDDSMTICGDADLFLRIAYYHEIAFMSETTAVYREHGQNYTTRLIENFIIENERILENLDKLHEGFFRIYNKEISSFRHRAQLAVFLVLWKGRRNAEARKTALKNILSSPLFLCLYILSFINFKSDRIELYYNIKSLLSKTT